MADNNDNLVKKGLIQIVDSIVGILEKVEDASLVLLFIAMIITCFYQVLCRYVLKISAPWTEEGSRVAMIWLVMIGSAWAISFDKHVKIDAIFTFVKNKKFLDYLSLVLCLIVLAFCARLAYASIQLIPQVKKSKLILVGLNIPAYLPMLAMPVGGVLMTIHSVCEAIKKLYTVLHHNDKKENK